MQEHSGEPIGSALEGEERCNKKELTLGVTVKRELQTEDINKSR